MAAEEKRVGSDSKLGDSAAPRLETQSSVHEAKFRSVGKQLQGLAEFVVHNQRLAALQGFDELIVARYLRAEALRLNLRV